MKTRSLFTAPFGHFRSIGPLALALGMTLAFFGITASAQIIPLSVPSSGVGPITFDFNPTPPTGWTTRENPGGNTSIGGTAGTVDADRTAMDAAVQTNEVAGIVTPLPTDSNGATPVSSAGNTSHLFRWNSARTFLESRPTGISYNELLLSLRNDAGQDQTTVIVDYDFGVDVNPGQSDAEDPGLIAIATQPQAVTVEQCRDTNLTVIATGTSPQYQWYKDDAPINGATTANLAINTAQSSDAGTYFVRVSNSINSVDSDHVTVTVVDDNDSPTVTSALAKVDGTTVVVTFSERMDPASNEFFSYHLRPASGAANIEASAAVLSSDGRTVTVTFEQPRTADANYELLVDPAILDCSQRNVVTGPLDPNTSQVIASLQYEVSLLSFENTAWKYNHEGVDLGIDWRLDLAYDDSAWSNGLSVFDGKIDGAAGNPTPRNTVGNGGMVVMTQLPLRFASFIASNVPCYYFRGHFTLPTTPSEVVELHLRTYVDDFDAAWMNYYQAPIHTNPGNPLTDLSTYGYSGGDAVGDAGILPSVGYYSVSPTNLLAGKNLVCVKLFNQAGTSSDITFAYELIAVLHSFTSAVASL